jgi:hypothetical protein
MRASSLFSALLCAGLVAAVPCPILPYDARPGYNLECVRGDKDGVYEDEVLGNVIVNGTTYAATVDFECVRQVDKKVTKLRQQCTKN